MRPAGQPNSVTTSVSTEIGVVEVDIAEPLMTLVRHFRHAVDGEAAADALREADTRLDEWEHARGRIRSQPGRILSAPGLELRLPRGLETR